MTQVDTLPDRGWPHRDPAAVRLLSRTGRIMAALAGAVGVAVLVSWLGGPRFVRSAGQPIEVAPLTAAALVLTAAALLLGRRHHPAVRAARIGAVLLVIGLAGARLLEVTSARDLGVDRALGVIHPALGSPEARTLPATAGTLFVTAIAMLLLEARRRWRRAAAQGVALALSPLPMVTLVGYAYGVTLVSEGTAATAMALPSSLALLLLVISIVLARPDEGLVAKLTTVGTGSAMARRMLLYAMALPLAIGWLALAVSEAGPGGAFAVSMVVVALTFLLVLLVLRDASALDWMELAKERAQEERERSREELARALVRERDARAHAEAASKAKDEFLNTLSHELRTPLNAILGWSRLLRDGPPEPERLRRGLAVVERNGRALAQVVADLLDMSRIVRGVIQLDKTEVDLVSTVEAAVEAVRAPADAKGIRIARSVGDAVPLVIGDTERLQQIAWNLLTNAVKFTPPGGRIDVRLSGEGGRAVLSVEDTGAGIGPEYMPHLFERFRQADGSAARTKGGLGLGLALTRELVVLHEGTIEAASAGAGLGATFRVSLPGAPTALPETGNGSDVAWPVGPRLAGARILVVDDEADSRDLLLQLLGSWGADARGAGSAREALAEVSREPPDILVSDIAMPGEDGFALLRTLRATEVVLGKPPLPAAALTAFARPEDRRQVLEAGFDAHVAKPVEPEKLLATLAALLPRVAAVPAPVREPEPVPVLALTDDPPLPAGAPAGLDLGGFDVAEDADEGAGGRSGPPERSVLPEPAPAKGHDGDAAAAG